MLIKDFKNLKKLKGKAVLVRSDFNVHVKNGKIEDNFKIIAGLPTLRFLLRYKCRVVVATHFSDTKKDKKAMEKRQKNSTKIVANALSKFLDKKVDFVDDCIGFKVANKIAKMKPGSLLVLEDLRKHRGEEEDSGIFAKKLAQNFDICVNDSFGVDHRRHASINTIKNYLPCFAGLLIEKEVENLGKILNPKKPLVAIIGGAKARTKAPLIKNIKNKASKILIGGVLANNFLKSRGFEIGESLLDNESVKIVKKLKDKNIILPVDAIVLSSKKTGIKIKKISEIDVNDMILDIGPKTIEIFSHFIENAKTIVWNGPLGKFENRYYKKGSFAVAKAVAKASKKGAFSVVGGGETIEILKKAKAIDEINWVSTGGGAMLTFLGGEVMPGLEGIINY